MTMTYLENLKIHFQFFSDKSIAILYHLFIFDWYLLLTSLEVFIILYCVIGQK